MKYSRYEEPSCSRMKAVEALFIYHDIDKYIEKVIDCKGNLNVYWHKFPIYSIKQLAESVWKYFHEYEVNHYTSNYTNTNDC